MSQTHLYREYHDIYGKDKLGKTRIWKASVFQNVGTATAVIQHGLREGKLQVDTRQYTEGKNIGKKNETSPLEQCIAEVEKKRKDKIEKEGYSETGSSPSSGKEDRKYFPMLANKYEPAGKKRSGIVFPCFVQPKLDGLRCVVYLQSGKPVYQSRTGGYFAVLQHLDSHILQILSDNPTLVLDGELYTQDIPFEELAGIIKKKTLTANDEKRIQCVKYHIYDIVVPDVPFRQRLLTIQLCLQNAYGVSPDNHPIPTFVPLSGIVPDLGARGAHIVPTYLTDNTQTFREKFGEYVAQGYEGIMLRNTEGLYQENYRSNDLMKYKEFFEAEYPIVDYKEASGRDVGTVIWECETPEGRRFSVRPRGTQEARREWFCRGASFVGKQLTVIYQELSEMGVPRFPVGKAIRDGY